jgi:hypothetical protein
MPRFRIRSLLIFVAVVALWLSTITGYGISADVRAFVMLTIFVASGVATISNDGRRRAFWVGFFLTLLAASVLSPRTLFTMNWVEDLLNAYGYYQNLPNGFLDYRFMFFVATIRALVMLLLAIVNGLIGILVYDNGQRANPSTDT